MGLGTVKFGRNTGLKGPHPFILPSLKSLAALLGTAQDLGINFLDTAPAYGLSEERIGALIKGDREKWILSTKVGEEFTQGRSLFDFSAKHTRSSLLRSLERLGTDYLDLVLIHSNGHHEDQLLKSGCMEALRESKQDGLIRAIGMSHKTVAGGLAAITQCDVIMTPHCSEMKSVVAAADQVGCGVLLKKVFDSGNIAYDSSERRNILVETVHLPGVSSLILGTINPQHLVENAEILTTDIVR